MIIKVNTLVFCENFMSTETFTYCSTIGTYLESLPHPIKDLPEHNTAMKGHLRKELTL